MAREKPTTRALRAARELIGRRGGWHRGWFHNEEQTAFCLSGALNQVAAPGRAYTLVQRAIGSRVRHTSISGFNDSPKTRKKDVLEVLDEAIEKSLA